MSNKIKITTFGQLTISLNDRMVDNLVSNKAKLLVVYLLMNPIEHIRKQLAPIFWSETTDKQALKNLRAILSNIRSCLPGVFNISNEMVGVNSQVCIDIDAIHFENECARLFESPMALDLLKFSQDLIELYTGEFLGGTSFRNAFDLEKWVESKRSDFKLLYSQLLLYIVQLADQQRKYELALKYAKILINLDPFSDVVVRYVMRLYAYTNSRHQALLLFKHFVRNLRSELETEPEAETILLHQQIEAYVVNIPELSNSSITLPDMIFIEPTLYIEKALRILNTPNCRLLTICGMSGIGKTTLATQIAFHRQHLYKDGSHFVSVQNMQSEKDLLFAIATILDISTNYTIRKSDLKTLIIEKFKSLELLLVFDNYEVLMPDTNVIQDIIQEAKSAQIIVTSRIPLSIYREWILPLQGLQVPDSISQNPEGGEAIQLFHRIVKQSNPDFILTDHINDIIEICHLVGGSPLGIILSANWMQYLPPNEIRKVLQNDIFKLESTYKEMPARHRDFGQILISLLDHISEDEKHVLMALSSFQTSFTYEAGLAIANITMEEFGKIILKGLVQQTGSSRYKIHNLIKQMFRQLLEDTPQLSDVFSRYSAYYKQWCQALEEQNIPSHKLIPLIEAEYHNLWGYKGLNNVDRLQFLLYVSPIIEDIWLSRGYPLQDSIDLLLLGGNNCDLDPESRIRGLITCSRLLRRMGEFDEIKQISNRLLKLEKQLNVPYYRASIFRLLAEIHSMQMDFEEAEKYLKAVIMMNSDTSVTTDYLLLNTIARAYEDLGIYVYYFQHKYDKAREYVQIAIEYWNQQNNIIRELETRIYLENITLLEKDYEGAYQTLSSLLPQVISLKDQSLLTIIYIALGQSSINLGDYDEANNFLKMALQSAYQMNWKVSLIATMECIIDLSLLIEHYEIGLQLFGFVMSIRSRLNLPILAYKQLQYDNQLQQLLQNHVVSFDDYFQIGYSMDLKMAISIASSMRPPMKV